MSAVPLAVLLQRVADEMTRVADEVGAVPLGGTATPPASDWVGPQTLDRVEQTLRCLAAVVRAATAPRDLPAVLADLPLAALAARLRGTATPAEPTGALELF